MFKANGISISETHPLSHDYGNIIHNDQDSETTVSVGDWMVKKVWDTQIQYHSASERKKFYHLERREWPMGLRCSAKYRKKKNNEWHQLHEESIKVELMEGAEVEEWGK